MQLPHRTMTVSFCLLRGRLTYRLRDRDFTMNLRKIETRKANDLHSVDVADRQPGKCEMHLICNIRSSPQHECMQGGIFAQRTLTHFKKTAALRHFAEHEDRCRVHSAAVHDLASHRFQVAAKVSNRGSGGRRQVAGWAAGIEARRCRCGLVLFWGRVAEQGITDVMVDGHRSTRLRQETAEAERGGGGGLCLQLAKRRQDGGVSRRSGWRRVGWLQLEQASVIMI